MAPADFAGMVDYASTVDSAARSCSISAKGGVRGKLLEQALVGSSNFTRPGLTENVELNVQIQSGREVAQLQEWFEHHWEEAEDITEDVIKLISRHTHAYTPFDIYTEGFSHFVTSMTAPVASGWSDRRVGLAPTGKAPPDHGAHRVCHGEPS